MAVRAMRGAVVYVAAAALACAVVGGCKKEELPKPPVRDGASTSGSTDTGGAAAENGLPASAWLAEKPEGARPLAEVKQAAAVGDDVVIEAQIGGDKKPYVDGRAVMLVIDPSLHDCSESGDDGCPTPWDFCCEDRAKKKASLGTVQFVGADGKPLHVSLEGNNGLEPLALVYVVGKVSAKDAEGTFTVDATGIHVVKKAG